MTYSIVARDPATGELGVAVQSHFFGVGRIVTWGEAGVGAVATQSFAEPAYGPRSLALLRAGESAGAALSTLVAADDRAPTRQVGIVSADGTVGAHTGEACIAEAGHRTGDGFSVQANMMLRATVWDAMAEAFIRAQAPLAERLLVALDAAEAEGGDIRGRQSAAILIVGPDRTQEPWNDRIFDLRVDDHPDPLGELRRLVGLKRAYDDIEGAEHLLTSGDAATAAAAFTAAAAALGENPEGRFWAGVALLDAGAVEEARIALAPALAAHTGWRELLRRLPAAGLLSADDAAIERALS